MRKEMFHLLPSDALCRHMVQRNKTVDNDIAQFFSNYPPLPHHLILVCLFFQTVLVENYFGIC